MRSVEFPAPEGDVPVCFPFNPMFGSDLLAVGENLTPDELLPLKCEFFNAVTGRDGWASPNGQYGWQAYNGTGSAQTFLNALTAGTGISIDLSTVSLLPIGFVGAHYRNPTSDNGYYLSTANTTTRPGITLDFSSLIKDFAMYRGSVDEWNTVTYK